MVKLFSQEHIYKHPWSRVTTAFWRKYPNKDAQQVKEIDTYERKLDPSTNSLHTRRIMACESPVPAFMASIGFPQRAFVHEQTVVNAGEQKMVVRSQNITANSLMVVEEECTYTPHPENPNWTLYRQEARIKAFVPLISSRVESSSLATMRQNANKGLQVMESLCQDLVQGSCQLLENFGLDSDWLARLDKNLFGR